ncbi:hypothetical protein SAMN05216233_1132 [Desulfoluna spongiiphila]|uniref:Uncharacterized protein n=1 Tax=Desulfoluna spongiiphila TaxID=419481 RepID=A0A1G5H9A5_9BACT|nr:hypothetical protein SAMN05216233_1132 [Desulfoluna spongiiphila]
MSLGGQFYMSPDIYFIDKEGRVKYDSGLSPYGFSPEELEDELSRYLPGK